MAIRAGCLGAVMIALAPRPADAQGAMTNPKLLLPEEARTVEKLSDVPREVRAALGRLTRTDPLEMADRGERFQMTCMADLGLPSRRLVFAAHSRDVWAVHYERGGHAHAFYVVFFRIRAGASAEFVWGGGVRGKATSVEQLGAWLRDGEYRDGSGFVW